MHYNIENEMREWNDPREKQANWKALVSESTSPDADTVDDKKTDENVNTRVDSGQHAETELEVIRPTPENPIMEVRIGLWNTLGQIDFPTRVVLLLKDGRETSIPWEEAEKILPPEYKTARESGERANKLGKESFNLETAIRDATDVLTRRGHLKDTIAVLLAKKRPALAFLERTAEIDQRLAECSQQCFLELRRMTNLRASRGSEITALVHQIDELEQQLATVRLENYQAFPNVEVLYNRLFTKKD